MKVFWKSVSEEEATLLFNQEGVEQIPLPVEAIDEMKDSLSASAQLLPLSARIFQDWKVGLWRKYEDGRE